MDSARFLTIANIGQDMLVGALSDLVHCMYTLLEHLQVHLLL